MQQLLRLFSSLITVTGLAITIGIQSNQSISAKTISSFSQHGWKSGVPSLFHHGNHIWISQPRHTKEAKTIGYAYEQDVTELNQHHGFNFYPIYLNANYNYATTGADTGAFAMINPHYRKLGKNLYQITSGATGKQSLQNELTNRNDMVGTTNLVKVYNNNHIKVWTYTKRHGHLLKANPEQLYRYAKLPHTFKIYEFK